MKTLFICIILLAFTGCATTTQIISPDGEVWEVKSKSDAFVEYTKGDEKIKVDNRGKPSLLEGFLLFGLGRTNVNVGSRDDD